MRIMRVDRCAGVVGNKGVARFLLIFAACGTGEPVVEGMTATEQSVLCETCDPEPPLLACSTACTAQADCEAPCKLGGVETSCGDYGVCAGACSVVCGSTTPCSTACYLAGGITTCGSSGSSGTRCESCSVCGAYGTSKVCEYQCLSGGGLTSCNTCQTNSEPTNTVGATAPGSPVYFANGSFSLSATNSAQQNYAEYSLGTYEAGTEVVAGTCGYGPIAYNPNTANRDTYLRLGYYDPGWVSLDANDNSCGSYGSRVSAVIPKAAQIFARAGCYGSASCIGTLNYHTYAGVANPQPANVVAIVNAIRTDGFPLAATEDPTTTTSLDYFVDGSGPDNYHFQAIQRLNKYHGALYDFVVSGSVSGGASNLFFLSLGTKSSILPWQAYGPMAPYNPPSSTDKIREGVWAGNTTSMNHPGGMQTLGRYLYIPVEQVGNPTGTGEVYRLDTTMNPHTSMPMIFSRSNGAAALGVTYLPESVSIAGYRKTLLMMVSGNGSNKTDLYMKQPYRAAAALHPTAGSWGQIGCFQRDSGGTSACPTVQRGAVASLNGDISMSGTDGYQNINLFTQQDGTIFLAGFVYNAATAGCYNHVDLWKVVWPGSPMEGQWGSPTTCAANAGVKLCLVKMVSKCFYQYDITNTMFTRGAGMYVTPDGAAMYQYATDDNPINDNYLKFNEFSY